MTEHHLKWTREGRVPSYQFGAPVPYRKWTPTVANPVICERGWHACRWEDAVHHISDELWVCELRGTIVEGADKVAAESLRLVRKVSTITDRTLRLFAADCAEDVLPLFETVRPGDDRPRLAIQAARDYANGLIPDAYVAAAAAKAAEDAAWAAGARAAENAVYDAVYDAAAGAAGAARAAAAARSARAAAAARTAEDAAWAAGARAAENAVYDAAARAARAAAARAAQTERLLVGYAGLNPADFAHNRKVQI